MDSRTLYKMLNEEVNTDAVVTSVICGKLWTLVENSEGGLGMALSPGGESRPAIMDGYIGRPVCEIAACVNSWNLKEAGIGMAAMNSFFNSVPRLEKYSLEQPHNKWCTYDLDLKDKRIVLVGHLKHDEDLFGEAAEVSILELSPQEGDYPASACEYIIPGCDILVITGSALVNRTMPRLLDLGRDAFTIITGPTAPMCERLVREYDIQRIAGFIPVEYEEIRRLALAQEGCSPYPYGRRFSIEQKILR